jgi:hypothetical protein
MGAGAGTADPEYAALAALNQNEKTTYYADLSAQTAGGAKPKDTQAYRKLLAGGYRIH